MEIKADSQAFLNREFFLVSMLAVKNNGDSYCYRALEIHIRPFRTVEVYYDGSQQFRQLR
jgi:hypothetical protein